MQDKYQGSSGVEFGGAVEVIFPRLSAILKCHLGGGGVAKEDECGEQEGWNAFHVIVGKGAFNDLI